MTSKTMTAAMLASALAVSTPVLAHQTGGTVHSSTGIVPAAHHAMPGHKMPHGMPQAMPEQEPPRLGVAIGAMTQQQLDAMQIEYGVKITEVMANSPAAQAGIRTDDVVTEVDGRPAYSPERMQFLVGQAAASATLKVIRGGQAMTLSAAFVDPKAAERSGRAALGVRIQAMSEDLKEAFGAQGGNGVLISQVAKNSAAYEAGMKAGDVITGLAGNGIAGIRDIHRILADYAPGDRIDVTLLRDRQQQKLNLALGSAPAEKHAKFMHPHGMYGHGYKHGHGYHGYGKKHGCNMGKTLRPS